ncbi:hypothetical protein XH99_01075 [Bradyrhizobium nanningense]|uniref:Uncharacterized protein n=1 Tax=Bradyrhizobium nanningense TaxID=1325118 RepID=A0A4Q0SGV0_9BRAD|nr:hypothetical protein [Bradyrhizobium nanningense]RXH34368.1 hypothetical protein XH84_07035 [Bradyrhizobium nanningense]RXH38382.1 hypothetical protein XH99_01075 [Bradyrhizobium nanningense]
MHNVLSRFTEDGLQEFGKWLQAGAPGALPAELLSDSSFAERLPGDREIAQTQFADRYEFGVGLVALLSDLDAQIVSFDRGLWSWLAAFYFEQLCPIGPDGKRNLRKEYVYLLTDARTNYRHLVRTPWFLVKTHGERCRFLLIGRKEELAAPLSRQSYLLDQLAARQFVITSPSLIGAAARLYSDARTGQPTRGAGAKGSGSPRRLALIANQLSLTYDIHGMPVDQLMKILPEEFGARWR